MPKVSSPGELGIGRGAGKLGRLNLPARQASASPEAFGAGIKNYAPPAEAFGYGREFHPIQPGKSGFDLLLDTVGKIADTGFDTALKVEHANETAAIQQTSLQNRSEWLQQSLALEATVEEGADPGEYAKNAAKAFDDFKAKKLEGLEGRTKLAIEQDLGELALHNLEGATNYQAQRAREHREAQNKATFAATEDQVHSYYNTVLSDPGQLPALQRQGLEAIDATHLPDDVKIEMRRDFTGGLAAAMWAGKVEQDPYGTRDAMLRGDVEELAGLEANDRIKYLHAAQVDIRGLEAEARQRENERKAELREAQRDLEIKQRFAAYELAGKVETVTDGISVGRHHDPETVNTLSRELERQIDASIDPDNKYRLSQQLEALHGAVDSADYAYTFKALDHGDKIAEQQRLQALAIDPDERTPEAAKFVTATKILKEEQEAITKGEVLEYAHVSGRVPLTPIDPGNPATILQREEDAHHVAVVMGLPDDGKYQRLPKSEAARIAEDINTTGSGDEVMKKIVGYLLPLPSDAARRVWLRDLEQQKLSPAVRRGVEALLDRQDEVAARDIFARMTVKKGELPALSEAKTTAIAEAVDLEMSTPGSLASMTNRTAGYTRDPGLFTRASDDRAQMLEQTDFYVRTQGLDPVTAARKATATLFGANEVSGNVDLGHVPTPVGEDGREFERKLEVVRRTVILPQYEPTPGASYAAEQDRQRRLGRIRTDGVWVPDEDGTFSLLDPYTGKHLITLSQQEVNDWAKKGQAIDPLRPGAPMPLQEIFGR